MRLVQPPHTLKPLLMITPLTPQPQRLKQLPIPHRPDPQFNRLARLWNEQ